MDYTNTDTTTTQLMEGFVQTTRTITTYQTIGNVIGLVLAEQDAARNNLATLQSQEASASDLIASCDTQLTALGYTGQ